MKRIVKNRHRLLSNKKIEKLRADLGAPRKRDRRTAWRTVRSQGLANYAKVAEGIRVTSQRHREPGQVRIDWLPYGSITESHLSVLFVGPKGEEEAWRRQRRLRSIRTLDLSKAVGVTNYN